MLKPNNKTNHEADTLLKKSFHFFSTVNIYPSPQPQAEKVNGCSQNLTNGVTLVHERQENQEKSLLNAARLQARGAYLAGKAQARGARHAALIASGAALLSAFFLSLENMKLGQELKETKEQLLKHEEANKLLIEIKQKLEKEVRQLKELAQDEQSQAKGWFSFSRT